MSPSRPSAKGTPKPTSKRATRSQAEIATKEPAKDKANPSPLVESFFISKLYNLPKKLGLSSQIQELLRMLDDVKSGHQAESELGRRLRLSPALRKIVGDTILQCTNIMTKKPDETPYCIQIIEQCVALQGIADKPAPKTGFPFHKLPVEIRHRIYKRTFGKTEAIVRVRNTFPYNAGLCTTCPARAGGQLSGDSLTTTLTLARTCSRIRDEILPLLYQNKMLSFDCTCEMGDCLKENELIRANVDKIRFHWRGPNSPTAIPRLRTCSSLTHLIVRISKSTTNTVNAREVEMQKFFPALNSSRRLVDAAGMDELLELRGLEFVQVKHPPIRCAAKRNDEELWHLGRLLQVKCKETKPANYGQI